MNTIALPLKQQRTRVSFYPALVIGICLLLPFYKYVLQIFPSIMTEQLMQCFHLNAAGLGNLAATFYYAYLITQCFVGVLLDRFNIRYVLTSAVFICALGAYGFAHSQNALEAGLSRACMGIGVAFAPIAYMKMTAMWCAPKRYAFVNGLLATASMLGAIFGESALSGFIKNTDWRNAIFLIAAFGFVLALICFTFLKSKSASNTNSSEKLTLQGLKQIIKNKQNWLLCLYGGFAFAPLAIFGGLWGNPFLQLAYHLNRSEAADLISFIFIGLACGSPILGILSDRLQSRKMIMLYGTIFSCLALLFVLYGTGLPIYLLKLSLFTFGFSLGAYMLVFAIGKEMNALAMTATVVAIINSSEAILDSLTEPLIGKCLDASWQGVVVNGAHLFSLTSYQWSLAILPCYSLVAIASLIWLKNK